LSHWSFMGNAFAVEVYPAHGARGRGLTPPPSASRPLSATPDRNLDLREGLRDGLGSRPPVFWSPTA